MVIMMKQKTNLATALFIVGILLAGSANALAKLCTQWFMDAPDTSAYLPFLSTVMFCLNLAIYMTLLLFWIQSLFQRLLPSRERSYLICAALCMIVMLILRSAKYRLVDDTNALLLRYLWYLYYIPMLLMPTLFLMTCLRIEGKNREKRFDERWLLLPAAVLMALFLTNELHHLAFAPVVDYPMNGAYKTYTNQILIYVYYGYYAVTVGLGLFLLTKANSRFHSFQKAAKPFLFLLVMLGLTLIDKTLTIVSIPSMFLVPETVSFGMLGVFESCIRNRLIPHNENYAGFFQKLRLPVIITQRDLNVAYRTAEPVEADRDALTRAIREPVYLHEDTKLSGSTLRGGYAFYTEDQSELNRLNERIIEANELIASENDLIRAENELRQRREAVNARNHIYARVAERMYPYYLKVQALLESADPDAPDFGADVARLNILNAYIKRATNLLLAEGDGDEIGMDELRLALAESARYLSDCGIDASVSACEPARIDRERALALYTSFEEILESLIGRITMLSISLIGDGIRLVADGSELPVLPPTALPAGVRESEGLYFFTIGDEWEVRDESIQ